MVSLALKLRKFHADHKGGHPDCIMNHEKGDVLKELLKPGNVLRLTSFRSEYMIQQFARILGHRSEFKKIDLVTKIKAHRTSFYQVDMTCGMVEADVFASVYGAALSSLVKNGSFRIDDVTDSMPTKAAEAATATATSKTSNGSSSVEGTTLDESGVSVNSQQRLSEFGIRMDYDNENDVSTQLKSAESLFVLRASMMAQITEQCRSVSQCQRVLLLALYTVLFKLVFENECTLLVCCNHEPWQ